ncbi:hypothetical protein LEP1GSC058_2324 [Leptospira fainei serovar Hurstbridge str. BUT 6]|uniref:Uncharacterized protein n=1 Tax=Leptospira fainei serovar Hurstbridge str. BUT 6 TaxID=1193011 RepID=S3V467_9LEPT|nr:hypothetical protein LEP1GSC058_2324 [Leptospira fainei serovar Hurstbridge str. BUT 6]
MFDRRFVKGIDLIFEEANLNLAKGIFGSNERNQKEKIQSSVIYDSKVIDFSFSCERSFFCRILGHIIRLVSI